MDKLKDSTADGKTKSRASVGRAWSGPEFYVNSGSGRVESLLLWVGLGRVNKTGPTSTSGRVTHLKLQKSQKKMTTHHHIA